MKWIKITSVGFLTFLDKFGSQNYDKDIYEQRSVLIFHNNLVLRVHVINVPLKILICSHVKYVRTSRKGVLLNILRTVKSLNNWFNFISSNNSGYKKSLARQVLTDCDKTFCIQNTHAASRKPTISCINNSLERHELVDSF